LCLFRGSLKPRSTKQWNTKWTLIVVCNVWNYEFKNPWINVIFIETTNSKTQGSINCIETTNSRTQGSMHFMETTNSRTQGSMHFVEKLNTEKKTRNAIFTLIVACSVWNQEFKNPRINAFYRNHDNCCLQIKVVSQYITCCSRYHNIMLKTLLKYCILIKYYIIRNS
jgi:hypothetical protein